MQKTMKLQLQKILLGQLPLSGICKFVMFLIHKRLVSGVIKNECMQWILVLFGLINTQQ